MCKEKWVWNVAQIKVEQIRNIQNSFSPKALGVTILMSAVFYDGIDSSGKCSQVPKKQFIVVSIQTTVERTENKHVFQIFFT